MQAGRGTAPEAAAVAAPQAQVVESTKTTETKVDEHQEEVVELDLSELVQENGEYVFKDPDNPEKTLYHGKTPQDAIRAMMRGVVEKDRHISKLKAERAISLDGKGRRVQGEDEAPEIDFPKPGEILLATAKEMNLDPAVLSWTEAQWKDYEVDHGTRATNLLSNLVEKVQGTTDARVARGNVEAMNASTILDEEAEIRAMVAEAGIPIEAVEWEDVLSKAAADPKNYLKNGIRKSGAIVRAAGVAIAKAVREEREEKIAEKVEKDIKEGKRVGRRIASDGSSVGPTNRTSTKEAAKTTDQAYERALAAFKD